MKMQNDRRHSAVTDLDDRTIACRGDHHPWPQLRPGEKLPRGVKAEHVEGAKGVYEIRERCPGCGRVRYKLTLPGGVIDPGSTWKYEGGPADFSARPGAGLFRSDYTAELYRRMAETITRSAS